VLVCGYSSKEIGGRNVPFFINKYNHKQSSMNNFYTYAYLREDGTPYYIGKGSGDRINKNHGRPCNKPSKEKILILKNNLNEIEAFKHEIYMISIFGRKDLGTGILHNRTNGGDGSSGAVRSCEVRKKISDSMKGKPKTKIHNERVSIANKGRIVSEDTKEKIRQKLKGIKLTSETKEKMTESLKKRWSSGTFTGNKGIKFTKDNPSNLKHFVLTDPYGLVYNVSGGLKKFCKEHSISYQTMYYGLHYKNGNATNGWKINYDTHIY